MEAILKHVDLWRLYRHSNFARARENDGGEIYGNYGDDVKSFALVL